MANVRTSDISDYDKLGKKIADGVDGVLAAKLSEYKDELLEIREGFRLLKGKQLAGCRTWKQFCEEKLNRTNRSLQKLLNGKPKAAEQASTGLAMLDTAIHGLAREGCFIALAGQYYHGKSILMDNLTIDLLENNKDVVVLFHAVHETLTARISRLLSEKFCYPSEYFRKFGYYLKHPEQLPLRYKNFEAVYLQAEAWLSNAINTERLVLVDVNGLPPQLPALEQWLCTLRSKYPNRALIVMGDNFHLYDLPGCEPGEAKTRDMHMFVKRLTTQYRCTIVMPAREEQLVQIGGGTR